MIRCAPYSRQDDLPPLFADLVLRSMARDRDDRPATMEQVAAVLTGLTLPALIAEAPRGVTPIPPVPADGKTVLVLPFRNAGEVGDEYLAEELTRRTSRRSRRSRRTRKAASAAAPSCSTLLTPS